MRTAKLIVMIVVIVPGLLLVAGAFRLGTDYRTADRSSAGIAPDPVETREAVIQVYAARAINWRGFFGVHTWIATKPENAPNYRVHQMIGWRVMRNLSGVVSDLGIPDRRWFGSEPELLADLRGPQAEQAIAKTLEAVKTYPYANDYTLWPGPNSNTFVAYVARHVPELQLALPVIAIGKDYPINGTLIEPVPSGTGYQVSLYGLLGLLVAQQEGIELNLLGLSFGLDINRPALKLPMIGRLGFSAGVSPGD
jgi:hypothetical protein